MSEKSKRIPLFKRLPSLLPWAFVFAIIIAGIVYAAHENQMRAERIITELSSELAVNKAELQLANNALDTAKEELEQSSTALAAANSKLADSIELSENAIVGDLFGPLVMREWDRWEVLFDTGVYAVACADLPVGIGFDPNLAFESLLLRGVTEPYINYNLRTDFANPLKSSGRYEKVDDHTFVRKDALDGWIASSSRSTFNGVSGFAHNYCKSLEMGQ